MMASKRRSSQTGSIVVDTTLGMLSFLTLIFFWIEFSWLGFIAATVDFAAAEASRNARLSSPYNIEKSLAVFLTDHSSRWAGLIDMNKIAVENCTNSSLTGGLIITACSITYPYQPLTTSFYTTASDSLTISRDAIHVKKEE